MRNYVAQILPDDEVFVETSKVSDAFDSEEPYLLITNAYSLSDLIRPQTTSGWQTIRLEQQNISHAQIKKIAQLPSLRALELGNIIYLKELYSLSLESTNLESLDLVGSYPSVEEIVALAECNLKLTNLNFGFWAEELQAQRSQWTVLRQILPTVEIKHDFDLLEERWRVLASQLNGQLEPQKSVFDGYKLQGPSFSFATSEQVINLDSTFHSDYDVAYLTISIGLDCPESLSFTALCDRTTKSLLSYFTLPLMKLANFNLHKHKVPLGWTSSYIQISGNSKEFVDNIVADSELLDTLKSINFCGPQFEYWIIILERTQDRSTLRFRLQLKDFQIRRLSNQKIRRIISVLQSLIRNHLNGDKS